MMAELLVEKEEAEQGAVALRLRNGENPGPMPLAAFLERVKDDSEAGV